MPHRKLLAPFRCPSQQSGLPSITEEAIMIPEDFVFLQLHVEVTFEEMWMHHLSVRWVFEYDFCTAGTYRKILL